MVLYKRKQVTFVRPSPVPQDLTTEIFVIPQTKEWFLEYEDYVSRMDYYHHRKFVCEITGNSCLTFFEAYDSELKEIKDVERNFPEALREHILRFLQFNRITRLDQLVDKVYLVFKNEYFPGEDVYVKKAVCTSSNGHAEDSGEHPQTYVSTIKQKGTIREKVQYSNPSDTKYLVSTFGDGQQIIATNDQISRDRNHFTKWLIKTFVKLTVTRSHKVGAPWVVKEKYAKKYRIPQTYPEDLNHFELSTPSGEILYEEDPNKRGSPAPPDTPEPLVKVKKPRGRSLKKKATLNAAAAAMGSFEILLNDPKEVKPLIKNDPRQRFPLHHLPPLVQRELAENELATVSSIQPSKKTIIDDLLLNFDLQSVRPVPSELSLPDNAVELQKKIAERVQEELEMDEAQIGRQKTADPETRAQLLRDIEIKRKELESISTSKLLSVQEALECWAFLNIYHTVLKLDTFTFDDFICAMSWNSTQYEQIGRCALLDEIWCAVLGGIVSNQRDDDADSDDDEVYGLQINLPPEKSLLKQNMAKSKDMDMDDEQRGSDSEQESKSLKIEDEASDVESTSETSSQKNGFKKETKNGKKQETAEVEEEGEEPRDHNAYDVMNFKGIKWHERLRKRAFKDGNWQVILLGLLSMVEYVPEFQPIIEEVYRTLAPIQGAPSSPTTVLKRFYSNMSIDLRTKALHILTSLMVNGTLVRTYIDESLEASTSLRRGRLDTIRDYKVALDAATKAHSAIHEKLLEASSSTENAELWAPFTKKKQRLNTKGYELTEYEKWLIENDETFKKLWEDREAALSRLKELKEVKRKAEMKLTEIDCQRVRLLGKDRLYNRYWWFENNGLPNLHFSREGGDEDDDQPDTDEEEDDDKDEVLEETYLMGKLWVQGPSVMDLLVNLKLTKDEAAQISQDIGQADAQIKTEDSGDVGEQEHFDLGDGGAPLKVMNFQKLPSQYTRTASKFSVQFHSDFIVVNGATEIVDRLGGVPYTADVELLTPVQRKFIEEAPEPLVSGGQWRYYDKPEDVEVLRNWLNPWGKRESQLRKEMLRVKDGMTASIAARRKALWLDKLPKEETEIETHIVAVDSKIDQLKTAGTVENTETEESDDDILPRKRTYRSSTQVANKRQKTMEETIKTSNLEELGQLQEQLKLDLIQKRADNQITRVLEWVNSTAKDELDKSLYDGGDQAKTKGKRSKK